MRVLGEEKGVVHLCPGYDGNGQSYKSKVGTYEQIVKGIWHSDLVG